MFIFALRLHGFHLRKKISRNAGMCIDGENGRSKAIIAYFVKQIDEGNNATSPNISVDVYYIKTV